MGRRPEPPCWRGTDEDVEESFADMPGVLNPPGKAVLPGPAGVRDWDTLVGFLWPAPSKEKLSFRVRKLARPVDELESPGARSVNLVMPPDPPSEANGNEDTFVDGRRADDDC